MSDARRPDAAPAVSAVIDGAAALGVRLESAQAQQLLRLAAELARWNKAYNLTAITDPRQVLTQHLLDSLAAQDELAGTRIADVGTGAGFPGLPLAIVNPQRQFLLIDAVDKKLRFIDHVARELALPHVRTLHARVEQLGPGHAADPGPQDTLLTRAFAPLPRLLELVAPLAGPHTRVVAMKGRWPPAPGAEDHGELPPGWRLVQARRVVVPGLAAERHLLRLERRGGASHDTRAPVP
ncbi:MAG: 16S rRNA (guanine(527)-N(7))-methyltransferase RsmG [Steroidobacteraceae bacterium]